jgi:hypothetical protein
MAKKFSAVPTSFPSSFDPTKQYHCIVIRPFKVAKMTIRPGKATLRGDVAQKNLTNLTSAWLVGGQ